MLEDVAELFTEAKVREVLLDTAARASAHIAQVSSDALLRAFIRLSGTSTHVPLLVHRRCRATESGIW